MKVVSKKIKLMGCSFELVIIESNPVKAENFLNRGIEEIMRIGHSMKGSGGGYGFDRITEIGALMENAAKAGNLEEISSANDQLNEFLQNVKIVWQEEE